VHDGQYFPEEDGFRNAAQNLQWLASRHAEAMTAEPKQQHANATAVPKHVCC
jgi:hypothetical protein